MRTFLRYWYTFDELVKEARPFNLIQSKAESIWWNKKGLWSFLNHWFLFAAVLNAASEKPPGVTKATYKAGVESEMAFKYQVASCRY